MEIAMPPVQRLFTPARGRVAALLSSLLLLAACGGGGGDDSTTVTASSTDTATPRARSPASAR
jgi:ABC-type glycerol-3-phosphate transport system substrate-binding protein